MLTVNMLGKANISHDGESIADKLSNKLVALICLLVLNRERDMSREKIITYLWPDSSDEAAKYNLRFNLWTIRKNVPKDENDEEFIVIGKDYCRINKKYHYKCDIVTLQDTVINGSLDIGELIILKDLFRGDFMEGLYLKNCGDFNEMVLFERIACQRKQVEILTRLANKYEEQEQYDEGLPILAEMASIEPYNESFAQQAIRMFAKMGNRSGAINYYKKFECELRRNLGISPDGELKMLYASLMENAGGIRSGDRARAHKRTIEITSRCLKGIEYFWAANVIHEILNVADVKYMLELDRSYIADLGYIQNELLILYRKYISDIAENTTQVPPVRIINAFIQFMRHAAFVYDIDVRIIDHQDMDIISADILKHIGEIKPSGLRFIY